MAEESKYSCRFYEQIFPQVDDVVMVNVRQIADMGAYVKLVRMISSKLHLETTANYSNFLSSNMETERV